MILTVEDILAVGEEITANARMCWGKPCSGEGSAGPPTETRISTKGTKKGGKYAAVIGSQQSAAGKKATDAVVKAATDHVAQQTGITHPGFLSHVKNAISSTLKAIGHGAVKGAKEGGSFGGRAGKILGPALGAAAGQMAAQGMGFGHVGQMVGMGLGAQSLGGKHSGGRIIGQGIGYAAGGTIGAAVGAAKGLANHIISSVRSARGASHNQLHTIVDNCCSEFVVNHFVANAAKKKTKTKGGKKLHAKDFAFVGDPKDPSTWKLPIDTPGHVAGAAAALGKGFRGKKVSIPAKDRAKVKAKVRKAHKKHFGKPNAEMPKVLQNREQQPTINADVLALFGLNPICGSGALASIEGRLDHPAPLLPQGHPETADWDEDHDWPAFTEDGNEALMDSDEVVDNWVASVLNGSRKTSNCGPGMNECMGRNDAGSAAAAQAGQAYALGQHATDPSSHNAAARAHGKAAAMFSAAGDSETAAAHHARRKHHLDRAKKLMTGGEAMVGNTWSDAARAAAVEAKRATAAANKATDKAPHRGLGPKQNEAISAAGVGNHKRAAAAHQHMANLHALAVGSLADKAAADAHIKAASAHDYAASLNK